ncbi:hypothetical protein E2C01_023707 [Portunus trituberculatus]|uniref:Uncharacterized protein n=1 Tax=Portunus trituberculatus TaxID=210409 RepID=A0A5B7E8Y3_PORTR|nr:hypothetical protein [Portunus trituberculatus]
MTQNWGKGYHTWLCITWSVLVRQFLHVSLSGVLSECPQHLPNLGYLDLAIPLLIKDAEGLLELCEGTEVCMGLEDKKR